MSGGIIQDPNLFRVAPYQMAGQIGRDPETGAIVGLGPETFASQFVMEDLDNDGRPDFLERYSDFFDTAGDATKSGVSAIESGIGQIADAEGYFPTAKTAVQAGQVCIDHLIMYQISCLRTQQALLNKLKKTLNVKETWLDNVLLRKL